MKRSTLSVTALDNTLLKEFLPWLDRKELETSEARLIAFEDCVNKLLGADVLDVVVIVLARCFCGSCPVVK